MYLTLVFLPFLGFIVAGLFGRYFGPKGSSFITVFCLLVTFIISLTTFYEVILMNCVVYIKLTTWINSEFFNVDWGFLFDTLTIVMCCTVTFVSFTVHVYSTEYMNHDPHLSRFMSYLSLFTFFMLILVTADNYIQLFVGWEGVGLCSYLLINFWFTRIQANKAAIKAMVVNRIGDFGLALGIFTIFLKFKSVDYATVFAISPFFIKENLVFCNFDINTLNLIGILLFIGAIGKSAQLGLHTWLPDAMEGPTPVSALIHAATMVTAGVFLLARNSALYEFTPAILNFIAFFGASTAFFAATIGLVQNDLKRVIAYSTCSQLGYMIFACGLSNYSVGIFHLINHAFFKALLFLGAGSIIHAVSDEQDMRKIGGLKNIVPLTYSLMVIGSLALIGFPFLTGFYSKDIILETAYGKYSVFGHFSFYLGTSGAFLTAFYSTRLIYLTFLSKPNGYKVIILSSADSSYQIIFSLILLSIPSIFAGYIAKDMVIGLGTDFWGNSIYTLPENMNLIDAEFIEYKFKILPVIFSILGVTLAFYSYYFFNLILFKIKLFKFVKYIYYFLNKKWFFDKIYNEYISQTFFKFGYSTSYKKIDKGIIEIFGPLGFTNLIIKKSNYLSSLQSNMLYHFLFLMLLGFTLILIIRQLWSHFFFFNFKFFIVLTISSFLLLNFKKFYKN